MQKIPYGESDFYKVITQNFVYVDKTNYIPLLENRGSYLFLLRPRRFGKSLFLSMLEHYYAIQHADDFDTLFSGLYIHQNPTPLKNSYPVLFMEFTGIETASYDAVYQGFNHCITTAFQTFLQRYGYEQQTVDGILNQRTPADKARYFFQKIADQKILLLIDEYDHFANAIVAEDLNLFQKIVGKGGFVRSFYEMLKAATQRGTLDRLFITGVTPLTLDSLTSGFNIGKNISLQKEFNEAMGFTHDEVLALIQPLSAKCQLDSEHIMTDLTAWYNGYRFHDEAKKTVFNANMVLYFLDNFDYEECQYPKKMLDENMASDYRKLLGMFNIGNRETNQRVLDELINQGRVRAEQRRRLEFDKGFDHDDFVSLLSYMGFVSLQGTTLAGEIFAIPNHVISELYFQYFKFELEQRNQVSISTRNLLLAVEALALHSDIQPLMMELERVLSLLSNRDSIWLDEQHIKTILLTLLYQSPAYFIQSEREMNRKYPDVMLLERSPYKVNYQHLIELKYSKKSSGNKGWDDKKLEGIEQVEGYLQLPTVRALDKLKAWVIVADGERAEVIEVKPRSMDYVAHEDKED